MGPREKFHSVTTVETNTVMAISFRKSKPNNPSWGRGWRKALNGNRTMAASGLVELVARQRGETQPLFDLVDGQLSILLHDINPAGGIYIR